MERDAGEIEIRLLLINMKVIMRMIRSMASEFLLGLRVTSIKESTARMKDMEKEKCSGQMEQDISVNGVTAYSMVQER